MNRKTLQIVGWIGVMAMFALLFGMWTQHNTTKKIPTLSTGTILPQPKDIVAFQLTDSQQHAFTNENFKNHWSFVFFGFTHCPQICPTTLSLLNQVYKNLQTHQQPLPQIVFISVDPERDTPKRLQEYLASFNSAFQGATAAPQQIETLTQQFNVVYAKVFAGGAQQHYSIEHSGTVLLINPQGQLYAIFSAPHDADKIAQDYTAIVRSY